MDINYSVLTNDEKAIYKMRSLYSKYGYSQFKMSKFEEYDLYARNKDFLVSENVITFTDTDGKLLALKPDVTLSIIKNSDYKPNSVQKLYYNENVYRVSNGTHSFKEIMQVGLECIGDIDTNNIYEVIMLAAESLKGISTDYVLDISNMDILLGMIENMTQDSKVKNEIIKCVGEKNIHGIQSLCETNEIDQVLSNKLCELVLLSGECDFVIDKVKDITEGLGFDAVSELERVVSLLKDNGYAKNVRLDFSVINDINYYDGFVFKGFINGLPSWILSGGQYDKLMKKMKKESKAIGFAVYLDLLERLDFSDDAKDDITDENRMLNVALPKGRLGQKVYDMFEKAGFECPSIKENNRKLIFENKEKGVRYFWVKPSDVAIYVERGAADIGVCGKDILLEYEPDIYELLDLDIGKCRMAVASKKDFKDDTKKTLKVATKFSNIAKGYYSKKGRDIDIIHLNGSIEIAPILGLSDVIVDIVETGTTLKENDLSVFETIVPISARLNSNKSGYKFKEKQIRDLVKDLTNQINGGDIK